MSKQEPADEEAPTQRTRVRLRELDPAALSSPATGERRALDRDPRAVARAAEASSQRLPAKAYGADVSLISPQAVAARVRQGAARPHVLLFYAAYCPACRKEMPTFVDVVRKYAPRGVGFTAIGVDADPEAFAAYAKDALKGVLPAVLLNPEERGLAAAVRSLGLKMGTSFGIPWLAVLDKRGRVVVEGDAGRARTLSATLDTLL